MRIPWNPIKAWRKRRHLRRLEAYHSIPLLLQDMEKRQRELVTEMVNKPLSPKDAEERRQQIEAIDIELIKSQFPEVWQLIEKFARENCIDEGELAISAMGDVILPRMMEVCRQEMENSMAEIVGYCKEAEDKELDVLRRLK